MRNANSAAKAAPTLGELVADVLGDLAFMVSDETTADIGRKNRWTRCDIQYRGPSSGRITCWCTRPFMTQLAANLLGLDTDDGEAAASAEDALQEFMNVLCGQFITARFGEDDVFSMSLPNLDSPVDLIDGVDEDSANHCRLSVGGNPFVCRHISEDESASNPRRPR